jgi:hypothetical protein
VAAHSTSPEKPQDATGKQRLKTKPEYLNKRQATPSSITTATEVTVQHRFHRWLFELDESLAVGSWCSCPQSL